MSNSIPVPDASAKAASENVTPTNSRPASRDRSSASTPAPATAAPPTIGVEKTPDDQSKFRTFLSILKKFIGVSDLAAVRFSLPAQLMEPIPNLEYWHYLDRPDTFASIGDSDDSLGRMLGALRFWFTKDLKYVKGRPCKPYNSTLGEFFRCNWQINETTPPAVGNKPGNTPDPAEDKPCTVSYITEQTSHHPPVSAYYIYCPEKGLSGRGYDQIAAKFTGTSVRVAPGENNKGIYVTLHNYDDETYNLTHPIASLGGFLRGNLNITVADTCYVTCPKTRLKAILQYMEEGWLGRAQNKVVGVVFKYDPDHDTKTRIKDVSDSDVLARLEGCWHEQISFTRGSKSFDKSDKTLLIDLVPLTITPKIVPPFELQLPNESQKYWADVTNAILEKRWTDAQNAKQEIENRQRAKKADRDARNAEWQPRFFQGAVTPVGRPEISEEGLNVVKRMQEGDWSLERSDEMAA